MLFQHRSRNLAFYTAEIEVDDHLPQGDRSFLIIGRTLGLRYFSLRQIGKRQAGFPAVAELQVKALPIYRACDYVTMGGVSDRYRDLSGNSRVFLSVGFIGQNDAFVLVLAVKHFRGRFRGLRLVGAGTIGSRSARFARGTKLR